MIEGHGSRYPKVIFVADKPVTEDFRTNKALSGYSERLLGEMCNTVEMGGLNGSYRTCYFKDKLDAVNAFKGGKELDKIYDGIIANNKLPYNDIIKNEITELNPFLVIPLGELSFRFLTGEKGIRKFRGSIMPARGIFDKNDKPYKVLPILGPNPYLNQEFWLRYVSRLDFRKIPKYLNDRPIPDSQFNVWVARNNESLTNYFNRQYSKSSLLTFDIETFWGTPTCCSFCFDGIESACAPLLDWEIDRDNRSLMLMSIGKLLDSEIPKVNQNVKYDHKILDRWGFRVRNIIGDTMLRASCIYPEFPKNLGFLTSIYTDLPYFKDESGSNYDPTIHNRDRVYLYNAKDSLATWQIYKAQDEDLKEQGTEWVANEMELARPIFQQMENTGLLVDMWRREELEAKYDSLFNIECRKLNIMADTRSNWNPLSHVQMKALVYDVLKFKSVKGITGTGEEELETLYEFSESTSSPIYGKDILKCIINCRKLHKVVEVLQLPIYPDGRFRAEWNLAGTKNARTTTGKCTDDIIRFDDKGKFEKQQLGFAIQNFGKHGFAIDGITYGQDLRSQYIADDGYNIVEIDLSQAEARVDAVLANDLDILSVFDSDTGIHRLTGSWIFDCDPSEIKKKELVNGVDRYHFSKTVRHAAERNMTARRLELMSQRPYLECKEKLDKVHANQPNIKGVFHREVRNAIAGGRRLVAPNGRCRDFFDRVDESTYNEAISTLPQMIVADQVKFAFRHIYAASPAAQLIFEAHDGFLSLVKEGKEIEFIEKSIPFLERPIDFNTCTLKRDVQLVIPAEAAYGQNWCELKDVK